MTDVSRYMKVYELRNSGMTFTAVGQELGVTGGRAGQMYKKAQRILKNQEEQKHKPNKWYDNLPTFVKNCLRSEFPSQTLDDEEYFKSLIVDDGLILAKTPNMGRKGIALIYQALSMEPPKNEEQRQQDFNEGHAKACISYLEKWGYKVIPPEH